MTLKEHLLNDTINSETTICYLFVMFDLDTISFDIIYNNFIDLNEFLELDENKNYQKMNKIKFVKSEELFKMEMDRLIEEGFLKSAGKIGRRRFCLDYNMIFDRIDLRLEYTQKQSLLDEFPLLDLFIRFIERKEMIKFDRE